MGRTEDPIFPDRVGKDGAPGQDRGCTFMLFTCLILGAALLQNPPVEKKQQEPSEHRQGSGKQSPTPSSELTRPVVNDVHSAINESKPREQSKWWPPPSAWDIYWPNLALVAIG